MGKDLNSIVYLFTIVVCKIVDNNRNGEGHDLEMDEEVIDDERLKSGVLPMCSCSVAINTKATIPSEWGWDG